MKSLQWKAKQLAQKANGERRIHECTIDALFTYMQDLPLKYGSWYGCYRITQYNRWVRPLKND